MNAKAYKSYKLFPCITKTSYIHILYNSQQNFATNFISTNKINTPKYGININMYKTV